MKTPVDIPQAPASGAGGTFYDTHSSLEHHMMMD